MTEHNDYLKTAVLIIGSGIAGSTAALRLADAGIPVTVVTRAREPKESNSYYAQGGIIYQGVDDSPALLAQDVMRAGAGRCRPDSVDILAGHGPELVQDLLLRRVEVPFDRKEDGTLSLAREGGHSLPRVIHSADATGKAITIALIKALQAHPMVTLLTGYTAVDLIMLDQHKNDRLAAHEEPFCAGATLLEQDTGRILKCLARNTILATGGLGQIFLRTTNPAGARGDGVAMAHRAGARVINMEFVQFHPTAFYQPGAPPFLISEAVRGAGARLVNADGRPFMQKYAPEWRDLAPRDVVARSIHQEMVARGVDNVYLDLRSYVPVDEILSHFPNIHAQCLAYGVDITRDLAPVVPAAHYACGGVWVDEQGKTSITRLYAVGEVACTGLHGANRLASTSLLEGLVWGHRAAHSIQRALPEQASLNPADFVLADGTNLEVTDSAQVEETMNAIRQIMWRDVSMERTTAGLEQALYELRCLAVEIERAYRNSQATDEHVGLRNAVQTALLVTQAALANEEGVGCHYRAPRSEEAFANLSGFGVGLHIAPHAEQIAG